MPDDIVTRLETAVPYGLADHRLLADAIQVIRQLRSDLAICRSELDAWEQHG